MLVTLISVVLLLLFYADHVRRRKYKAPKGKSQSLRLPPGPPGLPFVGHFFGLHKVFQPTFMYSWRKKYGDIVATYSFGVPHIFVFSDEIAKDLFEKRGATYSDRPAFHMAWLLGWEYNMGLLPYGHWWRRHSRAIHQFFNSRAVLTFEPVQMKTRRMLLQTLLEDPTNFSEHIQYCIGSIIMDVTYAISIKPKNDTFIEIVHTALEGGGQTMLPGIWLVDLFPILKIIPNWVPGVTFRKYQKKYRKPTRDIADVPFDIVKKRDSLDHSFVSISLERLRRIKNPLPDEEEVIKNVAGTAYAAGAGTTLSVFLQAIVASLLFPEVQRKLQAELDEVLGDRLPTLADRPNLPHFNAFCWEVMRWRPGIPLGVPHAALEDDVYGDYFIPKGSVIIADSWQILRSEKYGPNPEKFIPERFLQPGIRPPVEQFGFGRRLCPGRFLASNTFFLFMSSIFKVFNVLPMKDENGIDIPVTDQFTNSLVPLPLPFKCHVVPRSLQTKNLILSPAKGDQE